MSSSSSLATFHALTLALITVAAGAAGAGCSGCDAPSPGDPRDDAGPSDDADAGPCGGATGGDGCACGSGCDATLICDADTALCRAALPCDCAEHQTCSQPPASDALCLEDCDDGFAWNPATNTCDTAETCDPGAPGSIADACAAQGRTCDAIAVACGDCLTDLIEIDGACVTNDCDGIDCAGRLGRDCDPVGDVLVDPPGPACTACLPTHVDDGTACIDRVTCFDLAASCSAADCTEATTTDDATCLPPANCPATEVQNTQGDCVACTNCFDGAAPYPGVLGVGNGGRAFGSICVCDLADGYFQTSSTGAVKSCDADNDGWTSDLLLPVLALGNPPGDNPLAREQTCDVRRIDGVELVSDDANALNAGLVRATRVITLDEIVATYAISASAYETTPSGQKQLRLFEPSTLDEPDEFARRYTSAIPGLRLHAYGGVISAPAANHELTAAEANPLTKMCNHDDDDLNLDSVKDVVQAQEFAASPIDVNATVLAQTPVWLRFSYFLELDRSAYRDATTSECDVAEDAGLECLGKLVIAEKSRTADELEVGFDALDPTGYSLVCARGRDPRYDGGGGSLQANLDFARWDEGCASATGACVIDGHVPYDGRDPLLANALAGEPDLVGGPGGTLRFAGMHHGAQFKCASFASADPARIIAATPYSETNPTGQDVLLACTLGDAPRTFDAPASAPNPLDPRMGCPVVDDDAVISAMRTATASTKQNYFVAKRPLTYDVPGAYNGGCIDEHAEWGFLCNDTPVRNSQDAFGKLFCGCRDETGGAACEVPCGETNVFSTRAADLGTLTGFWLCAQPSLSDAPHLSDTVGTLDFHGGVPLESPFTSPACEQQDCAAGFTLTTARRPR